LPLEKLSTKYIGQTAEQYDRVRAGKTWDTEHDAIKQLLMHVPKGASVLDIPVGTGRLLPYFAARRFETCGIDVSEDMLTQARATAEAMGGGIRVQHGDIRSVPYPDRSFDLVVCLRFLNMIETDELAAILQELTRLSRDKLLVGIRYVMPFGDLGPKPSDVARLACRPILLARSLGRRVFGRRSDVIVHDKKFLMQLLGRHGLEVVRSRYVERRWDNTDYVLWLLQKQAPGDVAIPSGRSARTKASLIAAEKRSVPRRDQELFDASGRARLVEGR
jgi:SAM-dependent methyltransferase